MTHPCTTRPCVTHQAYANFATLARALDPLFDDDGKAELTGRVKELEGQFDRAVADVWRRKLVRHFPAQFPSL